MSVRVVPCRGCGREVGLWDGCLFELVLVPTGSQRGRGAVAVRRPGGAVVVDVRSLPVEPPQCHPQHLCSEHLSRRGGPGRVGGG
jgi:hypothetical protein